MLTDDVAAAVFDSLPSFIAVLGPDGTVIRLNEAWRRGAAAGLAVVPVRPGTSWLAACDAAGRNTAPLRTLAGLTRQMLDRRRDRARVEVPLTTPRGQRWLDVRIRTLSRGEGLVVVVDDVTDRHDREMALRHHATHDPVTGLPNRTALRDLISGALDELQPPEPSQAESPGRTSPASESASSGQAVDQESPRPRRRPGPASGGNSTPGTPGGGRVAHGEPGPPPPPTGVAVLFLDLDAFRRVNQDFGYAVGDETLRAVARRFSDVLDPTAILGRWGGDEFVVLAPAITGAAAVGLADRLTACLDEPLTVDEHRVRISVSVGVALGGGLRAGHVDSGHPDGPATTGTELPDQPLLDGEALVTLASEEIVKARARARAAHRGRRRRRN